MLDRWNAEDVSKEPDWSIADLQPITLRHSTEDEKPDPALRSGERRGPRSAARRARRGAARSADDVAQLTFFTLRPYEFQEEILVPGKPEMRRDGHLRAGAFARPGAFPYDVG